MIIGNGLLASKFLEQKEAFESHIIFASGVSDSSEVDESAYYREIELISKVLDENPELIFIYFSCVLVETSKTRYYTHKLEVEKLIKDTTDKYLIFRVPQIVGNGGNKNNLFNFFKTSAINNTTTTIYTNTERSIIDIDDLVDIVDGCKWLFPDTINISNIERISALELYRKIAYELHEIPMIYLRDGENNNWTIENSTIVDKLIDKLNIQRNGYTNRIIKKYINGNTNGFF